MKGKSMTLALLVETQAGELSQQTLILPHKGEVLTYHRDSTGQAGRGQTWARLEDTSTLPDTLLTLNPVAVLLTERDTALVESGLVTNIGAKALYALESAEPITAPSTHREAVENLIGSLYAGDNTLTAYITDKRRVNGITLEPLGVKPQGADIVEFIKEQTPPKYERVEVPQMDSASALAYENMISIPDPKWSKDYINRYFNDGKSDFDIYDYALENDINVLIEGGAGSGKTMSVIAYASARNYRYFNVSSNAGIDPSQLFGRWIPREDGHGYRWQDGAVTLLVRYGGVLLLNEVNFMPERIMTVLYSLLDDRREIQLLDNGGEVIKAHPDLLIVADMNAGYRGTHELSQANNDRWKIKLEFPYDKRIEGRLIKSKSLLELAGKLRDQYDREEITTPISTRGLVAFQKNAVGLGLNLAIDSYVNGFDKDERGAVRMSIETMKVNIARDLGLSSEVPDVEMHEVEKVEVSN
jgi:AAA domain (dynein-related subfamily)